jgi:chromosome segregation ATPase
MSRDLTKNLPPDGVALILARLDTIEARLTEMDSRLVDIDNRLTNVEGRLTSVEDRLDRRLAETRPIWEQVLIRLDGVDVGLAKIEERQEGFDEKLTGFDEKLTGFDQKLTEFDQKLTEFDQKLTGFDQKLTGFDQKLTGFDQKLIGFDERFVVIDQRLTSIEQHLKNHDAKFDHLNLDIRAGFKRLGRDIEQLSSHYLRVQADQGDLERRMDYLEDKVDPNRNP